MTLLALFRLSKDVFFCSYTEKELKLKGPLEDFKNACETKSNETIQITHSSILDVVTEKEMVEQIVRSISKTYA